MSNYHEFDQKPEAITSTRKYRVRVLVCAPSNSALDEIVLRVLSGGMKFHLPFSLSFLYEAPHLSSVSSSHIISCFMSMLLLRGKCYAFIEQSLAWVGNATVQISQYIWQLVNWKYWNVMLKVPRLEPKKWWYILKEKTTEMHFDVN